MKTDLSYALFILVIPECFPLKNGVCKFVDLQKLVFAKTLLCAGLAGRSILRSLSVLLGTLRKL
jgi:hypothetical protein